MLIVNPTPFVAGWNVGHRPDGRDVAVVVVKATFILSSCSAERPQLTEHQQPLLEADVFGPDPARDAPTYENDFALYKPQCDVLLRASAHVPSSRPVTRLEVGFQVGSCKKMLAIIGRREWRKGLLGFRATATSPMPFVVQPISYDTAFGGTDTSPQDPARVEMYRANPAGIGYCCFSENLVGKLLPTSEEIEHPVTSPTGKYRPMAFGPLGRHWLPRCSYAGTYDAEWLEKKMPFLPDDFDPRYFQAAPPDQQIPYPQGGEQVVLVNLTSLPILRVQLPGETMYVRFLRSRAADKEVQAQIDTVVIEPEEDRMCLTWRAACPLDRDPFELREMQIEPASGRTRGLLRARRTGKKYYRSLADAVRSDNGVDV